MVIGVYVDASVLEDAFEVLHCFEFGCFYGIEPSEPVYQVLSYVGFGGGQESVPVVVVCVVGELTGFPKVLFCVFSQRKPLLAP